MVKIIKKRVKGSSKITSQVRLSVRNTKVKDCKEIGVKNISGLHLLDLPAEVLQRVVSEIPPYHRHRVRATCQLLKNVCDSTLVHEMKSFTNFCRETGNAFSNVAFSVIHYATWEYVQAGYCPLFLAEVYQQLKFNTAEPLTLQTSKIQNVVRKFYELVSEELEDPHSKTSRLLYTRMLLYFLQGFKNAVVISSQVNEFSGWSVAFALPGSWLNVSKSKLPSKGLNYAKDRFEFILILIEIMVSAHEEVTFKNRHMYENDVISYGHNHNCLNENPTTFFKIKISASDEIINLLKYNATAADLKNPPDSEFIVEVCVISEEMFATGKTCSSFLLKIEPN